MGSVIVMFVSAFLFVSAELGNWGLSAVCKKSEDNIASKLDLREKGLGEGMMS